MAYIGNDVDAIFIPSSVNTSTDLRINGGALTQTGGDVNLDGGTFFLDESANRVGIGTITPGVTLDVVGTIRATNINALDLSVEDKNIVIGDVASPTNTTADGGGVTLKGAVDKTIAWLNATAAWTFSEHISIASAKEYRIAGTKVLDATSLGSAVVSSSLTSVGTIATGAWNGSVIGKAYLDATVVSTGDTGTVTSTMILNGTIVDADINASAGIVDTKLATIATAGKVSNSATTATNANTASAIVARDESGNFSAGTITAALTGAASSNVLKAGDTMTGALVVPLGAFGTPSLTFTGDLNTGIFSPGADQVAVATNGTRRLLIDSAGALTLDTGDATIYGVRVGRGAGAQASNTVVGAAGALASNTTGLNNVALGEQCLATNSTGNSNLAIGSRCLTSNSTGGNNIALGVLTLNANVSGSSNLGFGYQSLTSNTGSSNIALGFQSGYNLTTGSNNTIIGAIAGTAGLSDTVIIGAGSTERLRIDSSGKVGIGTSTPGSKLTIDANFTGYNVPLDVRSSGSAHAYLGVAQTFSVNTGTVVEPVGRILATSSSWTYGTFGSNKFTIEGMKPGGIDIRSNIDAPITFSTGGTQDLSVERLRITSTGALNFKGAGTAGSTQAVSFNGTSPVNSLVLDSSGRVGINTPDPSAKLEIFGFTSGAGLKMNYGNSSGTIDAVNFIANGGSNGAIGMQMVSAGVGDLWLGGSGGRTLTLYRDGSVGIGTPTPAYKLEVNGSFAATTKSFVIPHPTKEGYKLQHGSLEGPENGVYVRGRSGSGVIKLPGYWAGLIDPSSITVTLTPIGQNASLWVERIESNKIYIGREDPSVAYFYMVNAERIDVEPLKVEIPNPS